MFRDWFKMVMLVGLSSAAIFAQGGDQRIPQIKSQSQTKVLYLEGFRPHSTIVNVKNRALMKDTPTVFLLETPNEFRSNIGAGFLEITQKWSKDHPNSLVIEVHTNTLFQTKRKDYARRSYVWVLDDGENLNIRLVELGACDARTMLLDNEDEKEILVAPEKYAEFKQKVIAAEKTAKERKLGVWSP